jgi:hypothetical protein
MARPERETKIYITWLPFLIDSIRWTSQGWHIIEKERIPPKWKVLAPLSFLFPILRVTYQRIVAGGMLDPEAIRIASWMATYEPSTLNDPRYAAFFASTLPRAEPPDAPFPPGSSPAKADPASKESFPPTPVPTDITVPGTQQEANSESSSSQLPPAPRFPPQHS